MITIFSTCRSFKDERFNLIQRNAIGSWIRLNPRPQIIIMGDDPGSKEICEEFNLVYEPNVKKSKYNTPILSNMIEIADISAEFDNILCVSSDIIVFQNTIDIIKNLEKFGSFCGVSRKLENDFIDYVLDFSIGWEEKVLEKTYLGMVTSGDFFLYPRGFWKNVPEFIIGRSYCDSWLYAEAISRNSLIDLTEVVPIVHQYHHHNHISPDDSERQVNKNLSLNHKSDLRYANWVMDKDFIVKININVLK